MSAKQTYGKMSYTPYWPCMMIIPKNSKRSGNKYIIRADDYVWCDIIKMLTNRNYDTISIINKGRSLLQRKDGEHGKGRYYQIQRTITE